MLIIFVTVGTTWFILDEGNSVIDALYMVIIIITTVGYGMDEFMEDDRNQIFLIFYIVFGVALITTFLNIMFVGMLDGLSKKQLRFFDAEDSDCFTATTVSEVYYFTCVILINFLLRSTMTKSAAYRYNFWVFFDKIILLYIVARQNNIKNVSFS